MNFDPLEQSWSHKINSVNVNKLASEEHFQSSGSEIERAKIVPIFDVWAYVISALPITSNTFHLLLPL